MRPVHVFRSRRNNPDYITPPNLRQRIWFCSLLKETRISGRRFTPGRSAETPGQAEAGLRQSAKVVDLITSIAPSAF
jgi:hypothetical protein